MYSLSLTHLLPLLLFYTPENNKNLMFSWGIEIKHLKELVKRITHLLNRHKITELFTLFSAIHLESGKCYFCPWRLKELTEDLQCFLCIDFIFYDHLRDHLQILRLMLNEFKQINLLMFPLKSSENLRFSDDLRGNRS